MRQASPADQDWNDAYAELQRMIRRIGYTGTPEWNNPALARRRSRRWRLPGLSARTKILKGVFRAQFRTPIRL